MKATTLLCGLAVGAAVACGQTWATPVGMGPDGPGQLTSTHDLAATGGFEIRVPGGDGVTASPGAPNWRKTLRLGNTALDQGQILQVVELINVGQQANPGPHWEDWHERIVTPGWSWERGRFFGRDSGGNTVVDVDGIISGALNELIDFSKFDLAPGGIAEIQKVIVCAQVRCTGDIEIREFPTIPEPASLLLLGAGLSVLLVLRRRGPLAPPSLE
jgi:hypothetical protein